MQLSIFNSIFTSIEIMYFKFNIHIYRKFDTKLKTTRKQAGGNKRDHSERTKAERKK